MLNKINWADARSYRTGTDNEPVQFYSASLCNSTHLELLLGYFSSAAINVLSLGFVSFLFAEVFTAVESKKRIQQLIIQNS